MVGTDDGGRHPTPEPGAAHDVITVTAE